MVTRDGEEIHRHDSGYQALIWIDSNGTSIPSIQERLEDLWTVLQDPLLIRKIFRNWDEKYFRPMLSNIDMKSRPPHHVMVNMSMSNGQELQTWSMQVEHAE